MRFFYANGFLLFVNSIGCIFGELITKDAILQGQGELDQMDKVFKLVGVPTDENWPDFEKLPNAGIFRWKSTKGGRQLDEKFPVNSPSGGTSVSRREWVRLVVQAAHVGSKEANQRTRRPESCLLSRRSGTAGSGIFL